MPNGDGTGPAWNNGKNAGNNPSNGCRRMGGQGQGMGFGRGKGMAQQQGQGRGMEQGRGRCTPNNSTQNNQ